MRTAALLVVVFAVALAGCETNSGLSKAEKREMERERIKLVGRYCLYGVHSQAQFRGCVENVTLGEILEGPVTNAKRFANGTLEKCRWDAGPFCTRNPPGRRFDGVGQDLVNRLRDLKP